MSKKNLYGKPINKKFDVQKLTNEYLAAEYTRMLEQKLCLTNLTSETNVNRQWAQCKEDVGKTAKDVMGM